MTEFPLTQLLWWVFASLAVGGGLGMVTRKNPVASLLFLVLTFFQSAVLWLMAEAEFLAIVLVLVYVGAVMVLFVTEPVFNLYTHSLHNDGLALLVSMCGFFLVARYHAAPSAWLTGMAAGSTARRRRTARRLPKARARSS